MSINSVIKKWRNKASLLLVGLLLAGILAVPGVHAAESWGVKGTAGFSTGGATYPDMAFVGSTPYVVYGDAGNSGKTTVKKFDGTDWVTVGAEGFSVGKGDYTSIAAHNNTPYVAYSDEGDSRKAYVKMFDGANWVTVGGAALSTGGANYTRLAFGTDGTPYVAYGDATATSRATVKKFDGASWVAVGTGASSSFINGLGLAMDGNTPYLAYVDGSRSNKATAVKFNGATWELVGAGGFSVGQIAYISIAVNNSTPYVLYSDYEDEDTKASLRKFDGGSWVSVGPDVFTPGFAGWPAMTFYNNTPYVIYMDGSVTNKASLMRFNGSAWEVIGIAGFSAGGADQPRVVIKDGVPYAVFRDSTKSAKATVMSFYDPDAPVDPDPDPDPDTTDLNGDGTPDSQQAFVEGMTNPITGKPAAIAAGSSCTLSDVSIKSDDQVAATTVYQFPLGMFDFKVACGAPGFTTTVKQYFYDPVPADYTTVKFINGKYAPITNATVTTQTINGSSVLVITYDVTDGGPLDADGVVNGMVVDPAGPAVLASAATPQVPNTGYGVSHNNVLLTAGIFTLGASGLVGLAVAARQLASRFN